MKEDILQVTLKSMLLALKNLQTHYSRRETKRFSSENEALPIDMENILSTEIEEYIKEFGSTHWETSDNVNALRVIIADQLSVRKQKKPTEVKNGQSVSRLRLIFDSIQIESGQRNDQDAHYHSLNPLSLTSNSIFPQESQTGTQEEMDVLLQGLMKEAKRTFTSPETYLENMLAAFQKYTWCVASPGCPDDISFYDHARMTAALAACLTDFDLGKLQEIAGLIKAPDMVKEGQVDEPLALLVGGDFSGIQNFIYTLSAKRAAKTLRGRSFYLQLLTEAILRFVLGKLGLTYANVVYSGGGHFFLLAPLSSEERLPGIQKEITEKLLSHHGISLYFSLGWAGVSTQDFLAESISPVWNQMHQEMQRKKRRRYSDMGKGQLEALFTPENEGGNPDKVCAVCGREEKSVKAYGDNEEKTIRICDLCNSFAEQIGNKLPKTDYVRMAICKPRAANAREALDLLQEFGLQVRLDDRPFEGDVNHQFIWFLNDEPVNRNLSADSAEAIHYSVNDIPIKDSNVLSFEEIEALGKDGIERLGVLRMYIDNLGRIFKEGLKNTLGKPNGSLVRMATLSRQISLFFEGWIKNILQKPEYLQSIYAVYSGGDDLFLIGPWQFMPDLALEIVENLSKYTGQNQDIHLSGGLSFIRGKYPIHAAAEDAGELESQAKTRFGSDKNAFAFLDGVWHWGTFRVIKDHKSRLREIMDWPDRPRSLLHLIQNLDNIRADVEKEREGEKPIWGRWMWMADYHLKRMAERAKANPELKEMLKSLREKMHQGKYPYEALHHWAKAARWAELETR